MPPIAPETFYLRPLSYPVAAAAVDPYAREPHRTPSPALSPVPGNQRNDRCVRHNCKRKRCGCRT